MHKSIAAALLLFALGESALAQRTIVVDPKDNPRVRQGAEPVQAIPPGMQAAVPITVLQADLKAKAGADTIQFGRDDFLLDDAARRTLALQADWLRLNPMVRASIEGHADVRQTRAYALALGERRAAAVHSFLLAQGVSPAQLTVISWGKERPAVEGAHDATWLQNSRVATVLVREPAGIPAPAGQLPPPNPGWQPNS